MKLRAPELQKVNRILFFTVLVSVILYFGREVLILLTFAAFIAMLLVPVSKKLEVFRFPRALSSLVSVLIFMGIIAGIIMLISAQVSNIAEDAPMIRSKMEDFVANAKDWIYTKLEIDVDEKVKEMKEKSSGGGAREAGAMVAGVIKGLSSFVGSFLLMVVFTFLFLLHREKYVNFIGMLYREEKSRKEAVRVTSQVSDIARKYLTGRIISMFILALLYLAGFTIVGLKNALLMAVISALLTFVPYVGPLVGGLIPFLMAIMYGDMNMAMWVLGILAFAQLFDNYFIEPYVVGPSVNIGPFFTIFILVLGGVVWGIAGVILFLPLLGIVKVIFENVEGLKPYAYLIGDEEKSSSGDLMSKIKRVFSKDSREKKS